MFPPEDAWNTDVSNAPVDPVWTERLHAYVGDIDIHPDYGRDGDTLYGIPINVVPETLPGVTVTFDGADDESDPGPYAFPGPDDVAIEGFSPYDCQSDCHILAVQQGTCRLFEAYACEYQSGWTCYSGAVFDLGLNGYGQRPKGWTSADAAGLAITPGLVRYDEVRAGEVRHAIRFTLNCTTNKYVAPASHYAVPSGCDPTDRPPMGMRVRLDDSIDPNDFPPGARAIVVAMQKYGMILADNGSNFYFQGEAHPDWLEDDIEPLKSIPASAFEVLEMPPLEP